MPVSSSSERESLQNTPAHLHQSPRGQARSALTTTDDLPVPDTPVSRMRRRAWQVIAVIMPLSCASRQAGERRHAGYGRARRRDHDARERIPGATGGARLAPYDPAPAGCLRAGAARLAPGPGERALAIAHIGSTAVPGLPAKPLLDVMVAISDLGTLLTLEPLLGTLDTGSAHETPFLTATSSSPETVICAGSISRWWS